LDVREGCGLREDLDTDNCLDDGVGDLLADGG